MLCKSLNMFLMLAALSHVDRAATVVLLVVAKKLAAALLKPVKMRATLFLLLSLTKTNFYLLIFLISALVKFITLILLAVLINVRFNFFLNVFLKSFLLNLFAIFIVANMVMNVNAPIIIWSYGGSYSKRHLIIDSWFDPEFGELQCDPDRLDIQIPLSNHDVANYCCSYIDNARTNANDDSVRIWLDGRPPEFFTLPKDSAFRLCPHLPLLSRNRTIYLVRLYLRANLIPSTVLLLTKSSTYTRKELSYVKNASKLLKRKCRICMSVRTLMRRWKNY